MANNVKINYDAIVTSVKAQFNTLINSLKTDDPSLYNVVKNLDIYIEDEQMFVKRRDYDPNSVFIVIRFGSSSFNFATTASSITMIVFGTENKVKPTQSLLQAYASKYNLEMLDLEEGSSELQIQQIWTTPNVLSNFNSTHSAFRSLMSLSGYLVMGMNIVTVGKVRYIYDYATYVTDPTKGYEDLDILAFNDGFKNALQPQPFGDTDGFTRSETNFSTYTFGFSTYALGGRFFEDCLNIKHFRNGIDGTTAPGAKPIKKPNDVFKMVISFGSYSNFGNGNSSFFSEFRVCDINYSWKIGGIPTISVSFSR